MTPPAPKASGRPRLARFVSLVFLLLACFVLPQQAAAQGTATASIANIDEVSEGAGNAQFTVRLDRAVNTDVILNLTYLATAAPNFGVTPADDLGSDRQTTVTIPANETQATFDVPIVDDDIVEFNETAIVSISANTPADLTIDSRNSRGSVRITDNDTAEFSLAVDRTSAAEGVDFTFTVSLSERVARRMLVGWTATGTGDNPATLGINGSDLEAPQIDRGDLTFDALTTTSQQFTVRILDDGNPEPDETFTVTLSNPRDSFFRDETPPGLTVGSTDSQTVTIVNNDGELDLGPAEVSLRVPSEYTLPDTEDGEGLFVLNVDKEGNVAGLLEEVEFTYSTTDGTATAGSDYTAQTNQTRTILGSTTGIALPFVALGDNIVEEDETFTVTFTSDTDFVDGNDTTTVTIVDQDTALVSLEGDANAREDAGNITFTVELLDGDDSNPGGPISVAENVTVTWTATNGTATVDDDLNEKTGTATIRAGDTEATFTVPIEDDETVEGDETFTVTLSAPVVSGNIDADRVRLSPTAIKATGTITDDDTPEATVSIGNASVAENVSGGNAEFTVSLTQAVTEDVTLAVAYAAGATNGATLATDLGTLSDTVTITANTTSATLLVPIIDDSVVESDETFTVTISEGATPLPAGVTIGTEDTATGTITDDDVPTVNLRAVRDVTEGAAQLRFRIDLNTDLTGDITLSWRVSGGTASAADFDDRYADTGTATIRSGRRTVPIDFAPIIDGVTEGDETLELTISNPPSGVQIGTATATGTISNSDAAAVNIANESVAENGGSVDFTVSLSRAVDSAVVLDVIYEGTGDNPVELARDLGAGRPGTVTIDRGQTEATITVPVNNDALVEGDETFVVILRERNTDPLPDGVIIDDGSAIGTIVDNETGQVSLSPTTQTATEGGSFSYTVRLSAAADEAVNITWTATERNGTATVNDDLAETTGRLTFAARNNTAQEFTIAVTDDDLVEGDEYFTVTLSATTTPPTGIFFPSRLVSTLDTISDNDFAAPEITTQPVNQSVAVGDDATFTVVATGSSTLHYQWRKDGSDIAGATSASYTISGAAEADAGDYTVVVTNSVDTVTSSAATLTVTAAAVAPQITTQPTDQSVTVGENATFTVAATGTPTPTYQWRFDGTDISGATSASYTLSNAALTNAGDYTVVVTNTAGEVTSSAATLTVTAAAVAPQITTQPTDQSVTVGENATFTVAATGTPTPTYQWRFEGSDISGATSASYTLSNAALTNAGDYTVVVTNTAGAVTSTAATLTVTAAAVAPQITTQPTDQSVTVGENATFTVAATGTPTPTYQWRFEGSDISGATSASYTLSNAALTNAGDYTVVVTNTAGAVTSTAATLTVTAAAVAPQITTQPTDQSVTVGENATFTVAATGTPTPTYQWRFEGSDISGATSASYTLSNAALTNAGDYTVVVTNTAGAVTSTAATLTVTAAAVAPQITTQPTDQSVTVGENATFTVAATGTPTPTYQWRFEGSDISGATSASYTLSNAALTNAGDYTVVVTNTAGAVTSTAATLTVTAAAVAPQITTQPTDQSVTVGENATFTVAATGTPTPTYQWRFEGSDISGATSASYTLSNAALTNAGDYTVVVTNTAGAVTSTAATLTVTAAAVAPQITTQPTDQSVTVGENATFTVAATGTPTPTYQWRFDGTDISGATSASYTLSNAALTNAGDYTVVVTNTAGEVTSSAATLTVTAAAVAPQITTQPTDQSVTVGGSATFTVTATGTPTPTYQWRFEGSDIAGATSASYTLSNAALTNAGDYTVVVTNTAGAVTSNAATLTVTAAPPATAPDLTVGSVSVSSASVVEGASFTINATVNNEGDAASAATTLTYYRSADATITTGDTSIGTDAVGALAANGSSPENISVSIATAGTYHVGACVPTVSGETNTDNNCSTGVQVTVTAAAVAPQITTQPTDQSVTVGDDATFTVAATGTPTPTYQWRFAGSDISGATSASYTLSNAALTNAGDYTVVVTNTAGTVTSTAATLTVTPVVNATVSIDDASVAENGGNAEFTVSLTAAVTGDVVLDVIYEGSGDNPVELARDLGAGRPPTVTIEEGRTEATLLVPVNNDALVEGDETFDVTISEGDTPLPEGVTIGADNTATGTIMDNETGQITLGPAELTAAEDGTFTYTVSLSRAAEDAVTVRWIATTGPGDTATVDDDLQETTNTVTFAANDNTAQIFTIRPVNDNEDEDNETFTVTLGPDTEGNNPLPTGVTIGAGNSSEATIIDDDEAPPPENARVNIADMTAVEDASAIGFTVSLTRAVESGVTLAVAYTAGSADPGTDLGTPLPPTVTIPEGETAVTLSLPVIDDVIAEGTETFTVTLGADPANPLPDDVSIGDGVATGTITDNDEAPGLTTGIRIADAAPVAEDGTARFTITLEPRALTGDAVLDVAYAPGTAIGGTQPAIPEEDLGADRPATVRIPAGRRSVVLEVQIADDDAVESRESFTVTLSRAAQQPDDPETGLPPDFVLLFPDGNEATGIITDNDEAAPPASRLSVLIEPRLIGAGTALRRHVNRFESLTGTVARNRLEARETRRLSGSKDLGSGAVAVGGGFDESRWGAWIDGAWAGFGGNASGRQADVYGGFDFLGGNGKWLIGALIGYEAADLKIGEATYRADYTHFGVYGGARLSETLLFDGAATYGTATPDIALGDVSASYDAYRITARGALTGDFGLEYGLLIGSLKIQPQLGVLYSRETLGAFTDSAGGVAGRDILELGRFSAGPRLTWGFDGGRVAGGARVQWDFLQLEDGVDGRISGAADIGVTLDLTPRVTLGVQGDVDGIGVSEEFGSLGGKVEIKARF